MYRLSNFLCFSGLHTSDRESPVSMYRLSIFSFVSVDYIHLVGNPLFLCIVKPINIHESLVARAVIQKVDIEESKVYLENIKCLLGFRNIT